ncbi:MAG: glycosyltransferase family 92 protein [Phyllobacterium sp.]
MSWFKKAPPYTKQIKIQPPVARSDRSGIAIAAVVKNEGSYIGEWLRFHRAVGISHFIIYDDASSDDTLSVLRDCLSESELTVVPWAGRMTDASTGNLLNSQVIAFCHAILNFGSRFRWMAFIDVDEFLLPKTGRTVEEAMQKVNGFPNVSLPWHMFGSNGHNKRPAGPVARNYTKRGADPLSRKKNASNFKCIVDPCEVTEVSVHHFETRAFGSLTANDVGFRATRKGRKKANFYSADCLQLNHYYGKSDEELQAKLDRGPASPASRQRYEHRVRTAVENIEADLVEDDTMLRFLEQNGIELEN